MIGLLSPRSKLETLGRRIVDPYPQVYIQEADHPLVAGELDRYMMVLIATARWMRLSPMSRLTDAVTLNKNPDLRLQVGIMNPGAWVNIARRYEHMRGIPPGVLRAELKHRLIDAAM